MTGSGETVNDAPPSNGSPARIDATSKGLETSIGRRIQ